MDLLIDGASWVLLASGAAFCVVSGIGLLRMPEFYSRTHAGGISDSFGATLILMGLMLQAGLSLVTVKLMFVAAFLLFTSPIASHALVKAAYARGLRVTGEGDARGD